MKTLKEIKLDGEEFILLQALLKLSDLCDSGGQAKAVITEGQVKVDGVVETRRGKKIRSGQVVEFNGLSVRIVD